MEVIRYGDYLETKEIDCPLCESRLRYNIYDVKSRGLLTKDCKYVVCPVCDHEIEVNDY